MNEREKMILPALAGAMLMASACMLLSAMCSCLPPPTRVTYVGQARKPHVEITSRSVWIPHDCTAQGLCSICAFAVLSVHNPLSQRVKMRPFCEYSLNGRRERTKTLDWITLAPRQSMKFVVADTTLTATLCGPTDVTIQCGAYWHAAE